MEYVVVPLVILYYGLTFLYAVLRVKESQEELPQVVRGIREGTWQLLDINRAHQLYEEAMQAAVRRRRESDVFDWRKEGF